MERINKNFIYNLLYQVFIFIVPLITTPYISRVLGVENIGIYSYSYSIVYYFMLFSMLGIVNYGTRETAKCVANKEELSTTFCSIYLLQVMLNIICIAAYLILVFSLNYDHKIILVIQLIFLLSCGLDVNWLFFGLEEFKITVSRNIIIKLLSLVLVFAFVKAHGDLWKYTLIMSSSTFLSQAYLWIHVRKRVSFSFQPLVRIIGHFKPVLILFIPVAAYCVYRVMDKTMIGYITGPTELGFYESAEKIIYIPVSLITAIGTVMMPNMAKTSDEEFKPKFIFACKLCAFFVLPMVFGLWGIAEDFSLIFFGSEFIKTGKIIVFLLPSIIFSTVTNMVRNNYLIPRSKDKIYVTSTLLGAVVNLILNLIFIRLYGAYGACIGTVAAELFVALYQVIYTRNEIPYINALKETVPFLIHSIIMFGIILLIQLFIESITLRLAVQILAAIVYYLVMNKKYIIRDFLGRRQ